LTISAKNVSISHDADIATQNEMTMTAAVTIKLFATLRKHLPENADAYPVTPGTPVIEVIKEIGVPPTAAKLIFVNGVRVEPETLLSGGARVGVFPPVGGG
jgi:molybdopterin converting factor small subunit